MAHWSMPCSKGYTIIAVVWAAHGRKTSIKKVHKKGENEPKMAALAAAA